MYYNISDDPWKIPRNNPSQYNLIQKSKAIKTQQISLWWFHDWFHHERPLKIKKA